MQADVASRGVFLHRLFPVLAGALLLLAGGAFQSAHAQAVTLCVNVRGCPASRTYTKIQDAVDKAKRGDTIEVGPGVYKEFVQIGPKLSQVSLVGAGPSVTFIDATGKHNAILVGSKVLGKAGPAGVVITGFTLENAKFEGILVHDSKFATIWGNRVMNNDTKLSPGEKPSCAGLTTVYPFEINEGGDCGEGIHLLGTSHSTVYDNLVEDNAGGVLLSDDDAANDDNSVRDNTILDNVYDCGITLASHETYGVFDDTIADNYVSGNGTEPPFGAGIGLFSPGVGPNTGPVTTVNRGNVVVDNDLVGNGLAGVALHTHYSPGTEVLKDELVIGNRFSGNGGDTDLSLSELPNGIALLVAGGHASGLVFTENRFANESVDIAVSIIPPAIHMAARLNKFQSNAIGIENLGAGTVHATGNWWGCPKGPGAHGCSTISESGVGYVNYTPWLTTPPPNNEGR